ncbi:MAG: hypothetical protein OXN17_17535 [Candidatus Poribacteria bacterium]|nr:hypothetical protein [Candidatus Poribacteria bacterium]MDE0503522.1 hypothetical protein [Candidatus Poribacteria bacterium]
MRIFLVVTAILLFVAFDIYYPDPAAEKKEAILELMDAIPVPVICARGIPWYEFAHGQHDDFTDDVLLDIAKTGSDASARALAVDSLAKQKNARLIPFWHDSLANSGAKDSRWANNHNAVEGLLTIDTPESAGVLYQFLLDPETSTGVLSSICYGIQPYFRLPDEAWKRIISLTSHESEHMRYAAFHALLFNRPAPFVTGELLKEHLKRALKDSSTKVVRWALGLIGRNPAPELFPVVFGFLHHTDARVRVSADEALGNLLSSDADNFEMCERALRVRRWSFRTAPLLAAEYAHILQDERGAFAEAEDAFQTAHRAYSSNDAYRAVGSEPGATMLYRLIEVKQKRGDINGAIEVLNQLTEEYPRSSVELDRELSVSGKRPDDSSVPILVIIVDRYGYNTEYPTRGKRREPVWRLEPELRAVLENAPICIKVTSLTETHHSTQRLKFKVSIQNIRNDVVTLHCTQPERGGITVPGNALIEINAGECTTFRETEEINRSAKRVEISPGESFSFVGTLEPLPNGNHFVDFRFDITCDFESGEKWSHRVLANSVNLTIP